MMRKGQKVNGCESGHYFNFWMALHGGNKACDDGSACGVRNVDDALARMRAFEREIQRAIFIAIEGNFIFLNEELFDQ